MGSVLGEALEREVGAKVRERGLVVWLDREGHYSEWVDSLAGSSQFRFPVVAHRGSFLETLLALEGHGEGLDPEPLLIHVPGFTDVTIRTTPLLEAYKAGTRFERALETLVREVAAGQATSQQTEELLGGGELSFARVDAWFESLQKPEDEFAAYLQYLRPEWVLEGLIGHQSDLKMHINHDPAGANNDILRGYLNRHTGFSQEFELFLSGGELFESWRDIGDAFIGWLMCVEYVHDLSRAVSHPHLVPLQSLSPPLRKTSVKLLQRLRELNPAYYANQANQLESLLGAELEAGSPEDLGKVDTFSREDSRLLEAAVSHLAGEHWNQALRWAAERLSSPSVWVQNDLTRRQEWMLIEGAARLGQALASYPRPLQKCQDLAEALELYAGSEGAQLVDRAHREFEQQRLRLLNAQLAHFAVLHDALGLLRRRYREWVDLLGADFAALCERAGFLPEPELQQRHLYEQEVQPLTQRAGGKVAYFLVDALRYEMAGELAKSLEEQGGQLQLQLKARLSELPSITSVGMNCLAPVCRDGKLTVNKRFEGFRTGEYTVSNLDTRLRAMGERSLDRFPKEQRRPLAYALQDLVNEVPAALKKKVKDATLVVVHSREIDEAGEADVGLLGLDQWLGLLRSAVLHLKGAGVTEFVITADHGFMLLDETAEAATGEGAGTQRRYVFAESFVSRDDLATVPLESLGYAGQGYLMFRRDSKVFRSAGQSAVSFAHGGNSMQERVIPVLRLSYRGHTNLNLVKYRLEAKTLSRVMGCSRLKVTLVKAEAEQGVLDFASGEKVSVALRVVDELGQVVIKDAPDAEVHNQQLLLEEGRATEVYFTISSQNEGKVAVELFHPDGVKDVAVCRPAEFFPIDESRVKHASEPLHVTSWEQNLPEGVRAVFQHIEHFHSITEDEVTGMLGSPRKTRRFSNDFDSYLPLIPFKVMVESAASGKRWVRKSKGDGDEQGDG